MHALQLKKYAGPDHVAFAEVPRPTLQADELLVQVHAVGLNPIDNLIPRGDFKPILKMRLPATLGSDLAGVVVETGSAVTRFKVGDAVYASIFDTPHGSLADFAAVPEHAAALKPATLDFVQAASIPMVGLTAWQALHERMRLKRGQKIFIPAGSGGIGTFAIQLAKYLGAHVATTTSTPNVELVRGLGADEVIDYKRQHFEEVLQGYDAVLGSVRGDGLEKAVRIVQPGGNVVSLIGPPDAAFAHARGMNVVLKLVFGLLSHKIIGLAKRRGARYAFHFVRPDGTQLAQIAALLDAGSIHPVIDTVFPFGEAKAALEYLARGRARGKVVVRLR